MKLVSPGQRIEITGLPLQTIKVKYIPATTLEVQNLKTCTLYDARQDSQTGFFQVTASGLSSSGASVTINAVSLTTRGQFDAIVAGDVIEITVDTSGHNGNIRLFSDQIGLNLCYASLTTVQILSSIDVLLHTFDLDNIDLETDIAPDLTGSGVTATVSSYSFDDLVVISGSTDVVAGSTVTAVVSDSSLVSSVTVGAITTTNLAVVDANNVTFTAPVDGLELGSMQVVEVVPNENLLFDLYGVGDEGEFWRTQFDSFKNGTPPLVSGDDVEGIKGGRGVDSLQFNPIASFGVWLDTNISHATINRQMFSSVRIDPSVSGLSVFCCFGYTGTGTATEPDIFWGIDHADPGLIVRNGSSDLTCVFTDSASDEVVITGKDTGKPVVIGFTFVGTTMKIYNDGVEETSFTPVGGVSIAAALTFLAGDRGGITHDFYGAMTIDRALTPTEVVTVKAALLDSVMQDGVDPFPFPVGLYSGSSLGGWFDTTAPLGSLTAGIQSVQGDSISHLVDLRDDSQSVPGFGTALFTDNSWTTAAGAVRLTKSYGTNAGTSTYAVSFRMTGTFGGTPIIIGDNFLQSHRGVAGTGALKILLSTTNDFQTANLNDNAIHSIVIISDGVDSVVRIDGTQVHAVTLTGTVYTNTGIFQQSGTTNGVTLDNWKTLTIDKEVTGAELTELESWLVLDAQFEGVDV